LAAGSVCSAKWWIFRKGQDARVCLQAGRRLVWMTFETSH